MFGDVGVPELLIILFVVTLLFGVGKVGRLGKDLGTAVKEFRTAIREDEESSEAAAVSSPPISASATLPETGESHRALGQPPQIF